MSNVEVHNTFEHLYTYENALRKIQDNGIVKEDRTGTGTKSLFGLQMRFDLTKGFPLITTKKVFMRGAVHELLWFLAGSTNIKYLTDNDVHIWDEWADAKGDLGPVYGAQWRAWPGKVSLHREDTFIYRGCPTQIAAHYDEDNKGVVAMQQGIDQIRNVIEQLKTNPDSRRMIVSAWNPAQIDDMKLPPCHALFQFYTRELTFDERRAWLHATMPHVGGDFDEEFIEGMDVPKRYLDCQLYQRSADMFLGVPMNIASYALLTSMIAQQCNMIAGEFVWTGGDCHIYRNHEEQVKLQLTRFAYAYPTLKLGPKPESIFAYKYEDIVIENYECHPTIKAPVAV